MPKSETEVSATSVVQILVPKDMSGLIIGRGGEKIRRVMEESGCKIAFASEVKQEDQKLCSLIGTEENIKVAKRLIKQILSMTYEKMMIPNYMVGAIIGRGGERIRRIMEESGCKIAVAKEVNLEIQRSVTLTGTKENIVVGRKMIEKIVQKEDIRGDLDIVYGLGKDGNLEIRKEHFIMIGKKAMCKAGKLLKVSKPSDALNTLLDVMKFTKFEFSDDTMGDIKMGILMEDIMIKYLQICGNLKKSRKAMKCLSRYKNICQNHNMAIMATSLQDHLHMSEKRIEASKR